MTIRRACKKCGDEIVSNYFDDVLAGLGKRGSSFSDVDAITHDGDTNRFLFQEFKREGESMPRGQKMLLRGLARLDYLTVWVVRRRSDGLVDWYDVAKGGSIRVITLDEYRARFSAWWLAEDYPDYAPMPAARPEAITAADIAW